ncbi:amino acid transporter [Teratosphaeria nubilosa]|uniref:Amino acid transporter n=1 Tax=Teratosphaeria nubilosa TaxID=161662 RepID=A0A6G1L1W5_9PEZI|nr:amino acid transporter [Teratosphaeria nubilosa]
MTTLKRPLATESLVLKDYSTDESPHREIEADTLDHERERRGTGADQLDMHRMGKEQQTKRNFHFLTIFGFTMVLMATWEAQFSASTFSLTNGGTAGAIWIYVGTFVGFLAAIASMAEMASMAPTTGGQYHWVSEFAPRSAQKQLSYIVGWLCVLGWQVGNTAIAYLAGTIIQRLVILTTPSYEPKQWQGTLIIWAVLTFSIVFNTWFAAKLPLLEGVVLVLHILGFFAILVPLWVLGNRGKASEVFFTFSDGGMWGSQGLSCLVGMLSPVFSFIGPDSATHMSEELQDASKSLPRAMIWTAIINGALGFVMICTFCMVVGDLDTVLKTPTGYPFIQVFYNVTHSIAGTVVMTTILITLLLFGCVTNFATSSRQLWAFSRDQGTPFSNWLSAVRPGWDIPLHSIVFSYVFAMLLSLINLDSAVALNIITSLGTGALICSYMVSISCIVVKRLRGEPLLNRRWSLGRWGLPINVFSVLFLLLVFIMNFFPISPVDLTPATFNWNILIFGAVVLIAGAYYAVHGRHVYAGPVAYVRKDV